MFVLKTRMNIHEIFYRCVNVCTANGVTDNCMQLFCSTLALTLFQFNARFVVS